MTRSVVRIDRWYYRYSQTQVACCRLETWVDSDGDYNILVTERGDNPGPSVTNAHDVLRAAVEKWLDIAPGMPYLWFEQYDANSYIPPDESRSEVCDVQLISGRPHWTHVPDDLWAAIYDEPRKPKPKVMRRPKAE